MLRRVVAWGVWVLSTRSRVIPRKSQRAPRTTRIHGYHSFLEWRLERKPTRNCPQRAGSLSLRRFPDLPMRLFSFPEAANWVFFVRNLLGSSIAKNKRIATKIGLYPYLQIRNSVIIEKIKKFINFLFWRIRPVFYILNSKF